MTTEEPYGYASAPIVVDFATLEEFHQAVAAEMKAFEAQVVPAITSVADGPPFGVHAGLNETTVARAKYQECLDQGRATVNSLYSGVFYFQHAASRIVTKYQGSDAFAAARPADVADALKAPPEDVSP